MGRQGAKQVAIRCALALLAPLVAAEVRAQGFDSYETTTPDSTAPLLMAPGGGEVIGSPPPLTDVTYYPGQHAGHYFLGEYLLWQTHLPSTAYAIDMTGSPPGGLAAARDAHADFGQNSGFRAGLGYRTRRGWDAGFIYTSFDNNGYAQVGDPTRNANSIGIVDANLALLAFNGNSILIPGAGLVDAASQSLALKYRTYDLELGKTFIADETMALRIFGGVRFADIDLNSDTAYVNLPPGAVAPAAADLYTSASSSSMQGLGLRAGGEGSKRIDTSGFVLFARGAFSLLASRFDVTRRDTAFNASTGLANALSYQTQSNQVTPVFDIAAGLRYEYGAFYLSGGYEFSTWFNMITAVRLQNQGVFLPRQIIATTRGDLGFEGWFVRGGWNF